METIFSKGERVRVAGLKGEAKILDTQHLPGDVPMLKLAFLRPRSGKISAIKWEAAKNCTKIG